MLKWLRANAQVGGDLRFQNEAWALEQLQHDAIPHYIASGTAMGRPYIVMTLAPGRSLRKRLSVPVSDRGTFGENWVLRILETLLDAVCHIQKHGITHRDIKDDNVICDDSATKVTLIDFGFCKGASQPVDADSFYQVGAPRYSPPNKLRFPSLTHPTHDVFAVGVLAYFLLTNRYPWSVPSDQDAGFLSALMYNTIPPSVTDLNSVISYETSQLVATLLNVDDNRRPQAKSALTQVRSLIALGKDNDLKFPSHYTGLYPKVVRDPVHGDIRMTRMESDIIDTPEFQRLRSIRQLGFANLVFSGAEHTRFSHSVGTMHVADSIIQAVAETSGVKIDPEERLLIRCYALVHDIGHAPFGHTLEDELGFFNRHDRNPARLKRITAAGSGFQRILGQSSFGSIIIDELQTPESMPSLALARSLVDGHAGADVVDYVDRDSMFCGVDHKVDSAIYRYYRFVPIIGPFSKPVKHLATQLYGSRGMRPDASFAIESLLIQRYALFLKVYTHVSKAAAGAMLGKALYHIVAMQGIEQTEADIEEMGDNELLLWMRSFDRCAPAQKLARNLIERSLFKLVFSAAVLSVENLNLEAYTVMQATMKDLSVSNPAQRSDAEKELASRSGVSEDDIIIYWPRNAPGLQRVRHYVIEKPGQGPSNSLSAGSAKMIERHLALWRVMIFINRHIDDEKRKLVSQAAEAYFGMINQTITD